ncbi:class I adenylate-forming enzyme family protein [Henriciella aquimarina]|uniref:class I adenylate-forming enzyme family protein n=1 Tax=Henriciella aquimarina TaxID=545261 RepID=UPI000A012238|nr:fatty acid--CoA ligase family protein [Henriciella aquimarina]
MAVITQTLREVMSLDSNAPVIDFDEQWIDWGELAARVADIESLLEELGQGQGARIGALLHNGPGHIASILAVLASDRCLVTLNPVYPDETLGPDIEALGVPVVIGESADLDRPGVAAALEALDASVIEIGPLLETVRLRRTGSRRDNATAGETAIEMLTSGTTGKPKRVPLSRAAFDASFAAIASHDKSRDQNATVKLRSSTTLIINPVTHIGGIYGVIGALMVGRRICLVEKFSVDRWVGAVTRHRPKVAPAVPAALRMLIEADLPREHFSSLSAIISGTAPLSPDVVDTFLDKYGVPVLANYGATEFAGAIAAWSLPDFKAHWEEKKGAAGRIHESVQARIIDQETGDILLPGQEGVLELTGSQLGLKDGWLRTTDRAVIDEDNFLYVKGRADNAILRGGFKVHPDDIVRTLETHPSIREAAVIGVPDERLGEVPAAAIILKDGGQEPALDELKSFLRERLVPYQVPVHYQFVVDIPRTPSMKPAMLPLKKMFASDEQK